MREMTQKQRILYVLSPRKGIDGVEREGLMLTQVQARDYGILSMSSRVRELRDEGWPIVSLPFLLKVADARCEKGFRRVTAVRYSLAS
jgi:hypothetical protein